MFRFKNVLAGILVWVCSSHASLAETSRFHVSIVSEGKGSWGRATIAYTGKLTVEDQAFVLSITNVSRRIKSADPRAAVDVKPFVANVEFKDEFKRVDMAVKEDGAENDKRALGSAYMLTYLVSENVIYPFMSRNLAESLITQNRDGQVSLKHKVPETVNSVHFGSMKGSDYKVGPVRPEYFSVSPLIQNTGQMQGDVVLCWFKAKGSDSQWHIRRIRHNDKFPSMTHIMSATPIESSASGLDAVMAFVNENNGDLFKAYNRYSIVLSPLANSASGQ